MKIVTPVLSTLLTLLESVATVLLAPFTLLVALGLVIMAAYIRRRIRKPLKQRRGALLWTGQFRLGA